MRLIILNSLAHIHFAGVESPRRSLTPKPLVVRWLRPVSLRSRLDAGAAPLDPFGAWLLSRAGLDVGAYRAAAVQRRFGACLRQLRVPTTDAARNLLERNPELLPRALNTLLIGVTEFFRDRTVFDYLRGVALPALLKTRPGLRVLSAGSSEGHELYSMAMLLAETRRLENSFLQGIDCRPAAIARARRGEFEMKDIAHLEPRWRDVYFQREGLRCFILPELRARTVWRVDDLLSFQERDLWDIILFRNVAIYLNESHSTKAWSQWVSNLAPGGYLVTGKAERPSGSLTLERVAPGIYRKAML
ncbi:MAG TPA: CheR family methyltransferase [Verrucomicrobiae bacterium]